MGTCAAMSIPDPVALPFCHQQHLTYCFGPTINMFAPTAGPLRRLTQSVSHVLPVSDDGGSTAEIVRVIGGPAVGDIRSRCLRLADEGDEEVMGLLLSGSLIFCDL